MDIGSIITGAVLTATGAASVATGGVNAGPGETVVTGDSYSSVQVVNVINADGSGGTSHTEITTNVDGEVKTETKDQTFAPGEDVVVVTEAHAESGAASSSSDTSGSDRTSVVLEFISRLLHSVFGIFFR